MYSVESAASVGCKDLPNVVIHYTMDLLDACSNYVIMCEHTNTYSDMNSKCRITTALHKGMACVLIAATDSSCIVSCGL